MSLPRIEGDAEGLMFAGIEILLFLWSAFFQRPLLLIRPFCCMLQWEYLFFSNIFNASSCLFYSCVIFLVGSRPKYLLAILLLCTSRFL